MMRKVMSMKTRVVGPQGSSVRRWGMLLSLVIAVGMGMVLVKTVLEWARTKGYAQMLLWVTDVNARAEHLYARHGFVSTGASQEVRPGELEHEMSKSL